MELVQEGKKENTIVMSTMILCDNLCVHYNFVGRFIPPFNSTGDVVDDVNSGTAVIFWCIACWRLYPARERALAVDIARTCMQGDQVIREDGRRQRILSAQVSK